MTPSTYSLANYLSLNFNILRIYAALVMLIGAFGSAYSQNATAVAAPIYAQKLAVARTAFFQGLEGNRDADRAARQAFAALEREHPQDPVITAYCGSLDLLESARTWALWNKHTLAADGLAKLDAAVNHSPDNLEVRFIRSATTYHLPFFFHRREQAEQDFAFIAPRAEQAAAKGLLSPALAAAALSYYGQLLSERGEHSAARQAYQAAIRVDGDSPAGQDAKKRLKQ